MPAHGKFSTRNTIVRHVSNTSIRIVTTHGRSHTEPGKEGKGGKGRGKKNSNTYEKEPASKQQQKGYSYNDGDFEYMFTEDEEVLSDAPRNTNYTTYSDSDEKDETSFEFYGEFSSEDETAEKFRNRQAEKDEAERLRRQKWERRHDVRFFYHRMKREKMERELKRTGAKKGEGNAGGGGEDES